MTTKEKDTYETFKWSFRKAHDSNRRLLAILYAVSHEDSPGFKTLIRSVVGSKTEEMIDTIKQDRVLVSPSEKDDLISYLRGSL
jgi:hypothetical protein